MALAWTPEHYSSAGNILLKIGSSLINAINKIFAPMSADISVLPQSPSGAIGAFDNENIETYVTRCKGGDRRAFDGLVRQYQDMIYSTCVRLLGNRSEGEDAAQETFVKAFEGLSSFKGEAAFSTWLYKIAINVCRNRQVSFWSRFSKKAVRLDAPIHDEDGGERERELPGGELNPHESLLRKRKIERVREAIGKLPQKHKEIIILADIQELSYEEIQTITSMALGTIKSRLARAREALKRVLKDASDEQ